MPTKMVILRQKVPFLAKVKNALSKEFLGSFLPDPDLSCTNNTIQCPLSKCSYGSLQQRKDALQGWCKNYARNHQIHVLPKVFGEDSPVTDLAGLIDHEKSEAKISNHLKYQSTTWLEIWKHQGITGSTRLILRGAREHAAFKRGAMEQPSLFKSLIALKNNDWD